MKQTFGLLAALCTLAALLSACSQGDQATTTASCAIRVGDGKDGRNANVKGVYYPGEVIHRDQDSNGNFHDIVDYFPCNSRNYIVSDGKTKDANGNIVGDRTTPTLATTQDGTQVLVYWTAYWTPNETKSVLQNEFYPFCFKYNCFSTSSSPGTANNSTKGWNDMLGENFSPAGDRVVREEASKILTDASWLKSDGAQWNQLAQAMSDNFADAVRPNTGYPDDLFCGSGNSGWSDPSKPGTGTYRCSNVRFTVDNVVNANSQVQQLKNQQTAAQQQRTANKQAFKAAEAKYGKFAGYWLGLQDTLDKCAAAKATCILSLGGNAPGVTVPTP